MNSWPEEEFLPGEGYQDQARNLRLLARECEGEYQMQRLEESLWFGDGEEASEEEKKDVRADDLNSTSSTILRVVKPSMTEWVIGGLADFSLGGCQRHVSGAEDDNVLEITDQEWIEGSSLVSHRFSEWDYSGEETESDIDIGDKRNIGNYEFMKNNESKVEFIKDKFGVDFRVAVTFDQDMFLYRERVVNTRKCTKCKNCSYVYSAKAWFTKKYGKLWRRDYSVIVIMLNLFCIFNKSYRLS